MLQIDIILLQQSNNRTNNFKRYIKKSHDLTQPPFPIPEKETGKKSEAAKTFIFFKWWAITIESQIKKKNLAEIQRNTKNKTKKLKNLECTTSFFKIQDIVPIFNFYLHTHLVMSFPSYDIHKDFTYVTLLKSPNLNPHAVTRSE